MTQTQVDAAPLEATIEIAAPPAAVWAVVTDVARMSSWSPQVVKTFVFGGPLRRGTRFLNINHQGLKHWPTNAQVVRFSPHRDFAFEVLENWAVWSYELEPTETGTRVTHRRELPRGISPLSRGMQRLFLGGAEKFGGEMQVGMRRTLERMKAEIEG